MAILSVTELQEGTDGVLGFDIRNLTRRFHVQTDDAVSAKLLAESSSEIPSLGNVYQFADSGGLTITDPNRTVDTIDTFSVPGKPTLVEVVVNYVALRAVTQTEDPIEESPLISIDTIETEEPIFFDVADQPIQNSAAETFDPPLTDIFVDLAISITINEVDSDLSERAKLNLKYNNKLNKTTWQGVAPRNAWLRVRSNRQTRSGTRYWRTTYTILLRGEGWDRIVVDEGFKHFRFTTSPPFLPLFQVEALDEEGKAVNSPIRLNGFGLPLPTGDPPVTRTFKVKDEIDFNPLFVGVDL